MKNTFVIAEVGQAHEGSLGIAHSYIDALAGTGVDAIKFQTHIAEAESSKYEEFRVKFSYEDETRYDYWKRMQFTEDQWIGLKSHCEESGVEFMSSPFSIAAVELLERVGVTRYKVGSGEVTNFLLLDRIAQTNKPVIISTGMSELDEIENVFSETDLRKENLTLLQCTTAYPTQLSQIGLDMLEEMRSKFNIPVGLSDHSGSIFPSLAAVSLGASVIEVHTVFDKQMFGPDSSSSVSIAELKQLVSGIRAIDQMLNTPAKGKKTFSDQKIKENFSKSLCVNADVLPGQRITKQMLEAKKPGGRGIPAKDYGSVVNKIATQRIKKWEFIGLDDISDE